MKYLFDIVDVHNVIAFIKETHIYRRLQSCNQIVSCLYISSAAMILPTSDTETDRQTEGHQHSITCPLCGGSLKSLKPFCKFF